MAPGLKQELKAFKKMHLQVKVGLSRYSMVMFKHFHRLLKPSTINGGHLERILLITFIVKVYTNTFDYFVRVGILQIHSINFTGYNNYQIFPLLTPKVKLLTSVNLTY